MDTGIVEVDLHGLNYEQARSAVEQILDRAGRSVYHVRVIHGYHGGTGLKRMVEEEFGYGRHQKVKRISGGSNPGITELVLREL